MDEGKMVGEVKEGESDICDEYIGSEYSEYSEESDDSDDSGDRITTWVKEEDEIMRESIYREFLT